MLKVMRTTVIGGIVFLIPVVLITLVIGKALGLVKRLAQPMAGFLPVDTLTGALAANLLGLLALALVCFVAGLIARASFATRFVEAAEAKFLWNLPGYAQIKAFTDSLNPRSDVSRMRAVLCRIGHHSQFGFEMDRTSDGRSVVFLPGSPNPWSGSVLVLDAERIEALDASLIDAARCVRRLGYGGGALLKSRASPQDGPRTANDRPASDHSWSSTAPPASPIT